jgi:hypothetical protein
MGMIPLQLVMVRIYVLLRLKSSFITRQIALRQLEGKFCTSFYARQANHHTCHRILMR